MLFGHFPIENGQQLSVWIIISHLHLFIKQTLLSTIEEYNKQYIGFFSLQQHLQFFSLQQHLQYYVIYGQADKKTSFETVKGQLLIVSTQQTTKCCALVKYRKKGGFCDLISGKGWLSQHVAAKILAYIINYSKVL